MSERVITLDVLVALESRRAFGDTYSGHHAVRRSYGFFTKLVVRRPRVASPFVVFERDGVSSVAGSPPFSEAGGTATAGAKRPA
jgi:hypothetical protein